MRTLDARELSELARALVQPSALAEAGVIAACVLAAWLIVRILRGRLYLGRLLPLLVRYRTE